MDPNATLNAIRLACDAVSETSDPEEQRLAAIGAVEYFLALDDWICNGGFLPDAWMAQASIDGLNER